MTPDIKHVARFAVPSPLRAVTVSDDGSRAVLSAANSISVINLRDGTIAHTWELEADVNDVAISRDSRQVVVATESPAIDVYDVKSRNRVRQLRRDDAPSFLRSDPQQHLAIYPDGQTVISSGVKSRIYISDVASGLWEHIMFTKYQTSRALASPRGTHVALLGKPNEAELSGHVTMFRVRRGLEPLWTRWHQGQSPLTCGAFTPRGSFLATAGAGDGIRIWDVDSGEERIHVENETAASVSGLCFVGSRDHLIVASSVGLSLYDAILDQPEIVATKTLSPLPSGFDAAGNGRVAVTIAGEAAIDVWAINVKRDLTTKSGDE